MRTLFITLSILTIISAEIIHEQEGQYSVQIYDIKGQFVASVHNGYLSVTTSQFKWDAATLASGVYLLKMQTPEFTSVKKITLLK